MAIDSAAASNHKIVCAAASALYHETIKSKVEPAHNGKWIYIEPISGLYVFTDGQRGSEPEVQEFLESIGPDRVAMVGRIGSIRSVES